MGIRIGTLLEKNVAKIFELAGFRVSHQTRLQGYEIDVLAEKNGAKVICECKQYEKSDISVRNIIHLWDSKNKEINANKIVIALFGIKPNARDISLARKYGIIIWTEEDISRYLDLLISDRIQGEKILSDMVGLDDGGVFLSDNTRNILSDETIPLTETITIITSDDKEINRVNNWFYSGKTIYKKREPRGLWKYMFNSRIGDENYITYNDIPICLTVDGTARNIHFFIRKTWEKVSLVIALLNKNKEVLKIDQLDIGGFLDRGMEKYQTPIRVNYCIILPQNNRLEIGVRDKLLFIEE